MELHNISRISGLAFSTLSVEEHSGLEVAMLERKREENLHGKVLFWGKLYGNTQDYLIVCSIDTCDEFPVKKFYYWYVMILLKYLLMLYTVLLRIIPLEQCHN